MQSGLNKDSGTFGASQNFVENVAEYLVSINPLTTNVPHQIETSQLICIANQLTGFYLMGNIGR